MNLINIDVNVDFSRKTVRDNSLFNVSVPRTFVCRYPIFMSRIEKHN